jgi:hypothetical protein
MEPALPILIISLANLALSSAYRSYVILLHSVQGMQYCKPQDPACTHSLLLGASSPCFNSYPSADEKTLRTNLARSQRIPRFIANNPLEDLTGPAITGSF